MPTVKYIIASVTLARRKGILDIILNAAINGNLEGNCEPWARTVGKLGAVTSAAIYTDLVFDVAISSIRAEHLGKLPYFAVHLFVIGVGAIKRGMSEDVPELVSASLSTAESIKNVADTSRPSANREHHSGMV